MRIVSSRTVRSCTVYEHGKVVRHEKYQRLREPFWVRRKTRSFIRRNTKAETDSYYYEMLDNNDDFLHGEWYRYSCTGLCGAVHRWQKLDGKTQPLRQLTIK